MGIFSKKSFDSVKQTGASSGLEKTLGAFDLIMLGLGAIIGTGVFLYTGLVAATYAGPAVMLSYAIAGITCVFVALAYTELATMLPTSGSVYTYSYVAFGEMFAWLIGSSIILQLGFGSAAVASGWSGYMQGILHSAGFELPKYLTTVPSNGGIIDLPAFLVSVFVGFILLLGTKDSKRLNAVLVFIKMAVIFVFVFFATPHFNATNWDNFVPFGFGNVLYGASILFFAFNGFNILATAAEECKNPKRDLTIGIIGSLVISAIVYVFVSGLLTGIAPFDQLGNSKPLAHALELNGSHIGSAIVATGAVCGMTTVLMMQIYGQSRIFYVISRDGLIPKKLSKLHAKYDTPYLTIIIFSALAALLSGFVPTLVLGQLSSMGSLIDYITVVVIVMIFRLKLPDATRPFKCPSLFIIAPIALISATYLLFKQILDEDGSLIDTGLYLIYWFGIMFVLYLVRILIFKRPDTNAISNPDMVDNV